MVRDEQLPGSDAHPEHQGKHEQRFEMPDDQSCLI
jgi:hypothetical protein